MKEIRGNDNKNARIRISYSKKKPQVSFRYPDRKYQKSGTMLAYIFIGWVFFMMPLYLYACFQFDKMDAQEKEAGQGELNLSNYTEFKTEFCSNETYLTEKFELLNASWTKQFIANFKLKSTQRALLIIALMALPPFLIYFPFRKRWNKYYPDFQAWKASKKFKRFTTKDIKFNREEKFPYYVEIPLFNNLICDFGAKKDFSKYLKEFEIEEHKFCYCKYKKGLKFKEKKGKPKISKLEKNEWLWYARWYFDKKPISGDLRVIFK
jgi:hypothetical protein